MVALDQIVKWSLVKAPPFTHTHLLVFSGNHCTLSKQTNKKVTANAVCIGPLKELRVYINIKP